MKFFMFKANRRTRATIFEGSSHHTYASSIRKDSVRLFPMGGMGNVTKNMFCYEYRIDGKIQDILLVDCGIGFPDPEMYGVDIVIPDVSYLADKTQHIRGLVFTHGHEDHIGGIQYIYPKLGNIPMWGTSLTAAFANIKLRERKSANLVKPVTFDDVLTLGAFRVSFVRMTHSVPDAANLIIKTPIGIFYHGSDYKFDFNPLDGKLSELDKINAIGKEGVLCLLTDCLGSERRGFTMSEQVVGETLDKELSFCHGKFFFTTQSSNISRIQLAIELAMKHNRQVAFFGRSIDQNVEEAVKLGFMRFTREILIREKDLTRLPPQKQFLIVAGSQAQPDSALSRIANDNHQWVSIAEGDTVVFSADPIPGNEYNIEQLIEQLYRKGARVAYSNIMEDLHVSGHGSQGDLMLMLSAIGPQYILPIGGNYKHMMQYRRLAQDVGYHKKQVLIPEEGQILEFRQGEHPRVVEEVRLEQIMVDGLGIGDVGTVVLRDRQQIATEGIVVIVVPVQESSGRVTSEPDVISRGFVYTRESGELLKKIKQITNQSLKLKKGRITDWQFVRKLISENVAKLIEKETKRYPLIVPVIVEV
jgi:ribonuclease J